MRNRGLLAAADTVFGLYQAAFPEAPQIPQGRAALAGDRMNWDEVVRIADEAGPRYATLDVWAYNTKADVARLREAGWSDSAILDLTLVVGYFAFVNRIADGLGVTLEEGYGSAQP